MTQSHKIAIVGGGASGIFLAVLLKQAKIHFVLFEKNKILGKKLLATGNGRCNIYNTHTSASFFHTSSFSKDSLNKILKSLDFKAFNEICQDLGLFLEVLEDGRVYPLSNSSISVMKVFLSILKDEDIWLENEVIAISSTPEGFLLQSLKSPQSKLKSQNDSQILQIPQAHYFKSVVLACGSEAAPKLGGSSKGYELAKSLGLKCITTAPSLVPLCCKELFSGVNGVKLKVKIILKKQKKVILEVYDDLLFRDYGISGFGVLDISAKMTEPCEQYTIQLDFLPKWDYKTLENRLLKLAKKYSNVGDMLCGLLNSKIAYAFEKKYKITTLNPKSIKTLAFNLKNFEFNITQKCGFDAAEVSSGGISGSEINAEKMESCKIKNLYLIGEMLDVAGDRGGHNLAFAWASAFVCFKALVQNY